MTRSPWTKTVVCGPSTHPCGQRTGSDRPPHRRMRTLDQDNNFMVDERTNFLFWTVHLLNRIGRLTKIIILRWTSGQIFDDGPSTQWTDSDDGPWLFVIDGRRWTKTDRPCHGRIQTTYHQKYKNVDGGGQMDEIKDHFAISSLMQKKI